MTCIITKGVENIIVRNKSANTNCLREMELESSHKYLCQRSIQLSCISFLHVASWESNPLV